MTGKLFLASLGILLATLLAFGPVLAEVAGAESAPTSPLGSWTDSRCGNCHQMPATLSHPMGVQPVSSGSLPLDDAGRMACTTCHADDVDSHHLARINHTPMLRDGLSPIALCGQCHQQKSADRVTAHALAVGKAHHVRPVTKWTTDSSRPTLAKEIPSQLCITCHDGRVSSDGGFGGSETFRDALGNHPVGIKYPAPSKSSINSLRAASMLDPRIRLIDGEVGCQSCHSLYSREPKLLVITSQQSQLCLACHAM